MEQFLKVIYHKILLNQISLSFFSGLIGALIAGCISWLATIQTHKNNLELEEKKNKETEKAVVLSIVEELKVLKATYQNNMDYLYNNLQENKYIDVYYTITQDFMTIYSNNANKIGTIKDEKLRNLIIKSYTFLKRYIEHLLNYATELKDFEKCRSEFIARAYPNLINSACSKANNELEIDKIKKYFDKKIWTWLKTPYLNEAHVINFIKSDNEQIENLVYSSKYLKQMYDELKILIDDTVNLASVLYKE